jgi:hypothetical protein
VLLAIVLQTVTHKGGERARGFFSRYPAQSSLATVPFGKLSCCIWDMQTQIKAGVRAQFHLIALRRLE